MQHREKMERIVCNHQWESVREWVDCFHQLADLTEEEISLLLKFPSLRPEPGPKTCEDLARDVRPSAA
jgi:hypothetical protein